MHNLDIFDVNNESMLGEEKNKDNITHEEVEETNTETKTNEKHDNSKSRRNKHLKNENADICERQYALYICRQTQMIRFHVSVHCCRMAGQRAESSRDKRYREQNHAKENF